MIFFRFRASQERPKIDAKTHSKKHRKKTSKKWILVSILASKNLPWALLGRLLGTFGRLLAGLGRLLGASWLSGRLRAGFSRPPRESGGSSWHAFWPRFLHTIAESTCCMNCCMKPILAFTYVFLSPPAARRYVRSTWNWSQVGSKCLRRRWGEQS